MPLLPARRLRDGHRRDGPSGRRRRRLRFPWFSVAALLPAVLIVLAFTIVPLLWAVRTSFERNNGVRSRWALR